MNRDAFVVDEPIGPRWEAGLQFLREGKHIACMGLGLTSASERPPHPDAPESVLKVRVQTRRDPSRITREQAAAELSNAEAGVRELSDRSRGFAEFVLGLDVMYELIDDYGMGSVRLAVKDARGFRFESKA